MIVIRKSEVPEIIQRFYHYFKGENAKKLANRIMVHCIGVSRDRIQDWINHSEQHFSKKPIFSNKDKLRPVKAKEPYEALQVDLVDFTSFPSIVKNKRFNFVLSMLDVFSRFLVLRPLKNKDSAEVSFELQQLFRIFGYPKRLQTDQGSEFKGLSLFLGIFTSHLLMCYKFS